MQSSVVRGIAFIVFAGAIGLGALVSCGLMRSEFAAFAAALGAIAGVIWASAEQFRNREVERSKFYLESAKAAVDQAEELLKDWNNNRVTWITAGRILGRALSVAESITEPQHKVIWEVARETHRSRFGQLLGFESAYITGSFFYGAPSWQQLSIETAAANASAPAEVGGRHLGSNVLEIAESSLYAVWKFCEYPERYSDPLTGLQFTDPEIKKAALTFPGLAEFLHHKRKFHTIAGQLVQKKQPNEKGGQTGSE